MFVSDDQCLLCSAGKTPIRRHWCTDSQVVVGLLLLQYKFVGGNIHSSTLRNALMSSPLDMSPSRATKTMKALREGNTARCVGCYDPKCLNFICTHECDHDLNKCKKSCRHSCLFDGCEHLCIECSEKCEETHSYFISLVDVLDPRRSKIWISPIGLQYLDYKMENLVQKRVEMPLEYEGLLAENAI
ncbi:hypothetical protein LCGC14_0194810 [marine sediment metagenome]|uniref:Uncharacterized protein n=1 Tax=marine sediment metagenome TaxID=412755 RepID=A0A0F9UPS9_9ZZZZ